MKQYLIPFDIEDVVYFKTDQEQLSHIVTGILIRKEGTKVLVSNNGYETEVYPFELSRNKNVLIKLGVDAN